MALKTTHYMSEKEMAIEMIKRIGNGVAKEGSETARKVLEMDEGPFRNRLYQLKNQKLSLEHLLVIQDLSETTLLAEYCLPEGYVIVKEPSTSDCDLVELATIIIETQGAHGDLHAFIKTALSDDRLTQDEQFGIDAKKKAYIAHLERQLKALKMIYGEKQ